MGHHQNGLAAASSTVLLAGAAAAATKCRTFKYENVLSLLQKQGSFFLKDDFSNNKVQDNFLVRRNPIWKKENKNK